MEDATSLYIQARFWCDALNLLINQLILPYGNDMQDIPVDIDIDPMLNLDLESPSSKSA